MSKFTSFLTPLIEAYVSYQKASAHWNEASYEPNILLFDRYCKKHYPETMLLSQEMVDGWCHKRNTETNNSCRSRIYVVSSFIQYLRKRGKTEEWLRWLMEQRSCSSETCNNRLASLRAFLKYLGSREISLLYLSEDATRIPRKKEVHKKVKGISKKAVQALLSVPDLSIKAGRRDLALMIIIYSTAARIDEILSLKIEQLHFGIEKPNITIIGKGNKIRTLYLLPKAVAHLKKYLKEFHGDVLTPEAYVFYSRNVGLHGKMSQTAVNKQLKKHASTAHEICDEVPLDLHAHQLRHAKASHWLQDGMNVVQISFLLGHEQLQTTMVYLDITLEQELKALATLEDENDKGVSKKWKKV